MGSYKFRVLLDSEKNEETFRDIQINQHDNFESFFRTIVKAFRFEGNQVASFYESNDDWDKGHEIALTDMRYSDDEDISIMKESQLVDFMHEPDQKFILVYDFLRMWIFLVELVETSPDDVIEPLITLSIGIAPPEDSKMMAEDMDFLEDEDELDDEDAFGDDDFEDGYDEEDYAGYDEY